MRNLPIGIFKLTIPTSCYFLRTISYALAFVDGFTGTTQTTCGSGMQPFFMTPIVFKIMLIYYILIYHY